MDNVITYSGVLRQNGFQDPKQLRDGEVALMKNLVIDKTALKPMIRGGLTQKSSFSYNIVSSYSALGLLFAADSNGALWESSDGSTWTSIYTSLNGKQVVFATYNDKVYLSDGAKIITTDGTTVWDYGIDPPDTTDWTAYFTTGSWKDGHYKYVFCYVTDEGQYSRPSIPVVVYGSSAIGKIRIEWTAGTYRSDIKSLAIFRTENKGSDYYYLKTVSYEDEYFEDEAADEELDLTWVAPFGHEVIYAKALGMHRDRLFLGNVKIKKIVANELPVTSVPSATLSGWTKCSEQMQMSDASVGGGLTAGATYDYKLIFVTPDGIQSRTLAKSHTISSGDAIQIDFIPMARAGSITKLYRKSQTTSFYHLVESWTVSSNFTLQLTDFFKNYTDTTSDAGLGADKLGIYDDEIEYSSAFLYSEIGAPEQIDALNIWQVKPDETDVISGIKSTDKGVLIFKNSSMHFVDDYGTPVNWRIEEISATVGCDNAYAIQKFGNHIYFTKSKEVYRFPDFIQSPISRPITPTIDGLSDYTDSFILRKYNWYGVLDGTNILIFDEDVGGWYIFNTLSLKSLVGVNEGSLDGNFYLFNTLALLYDTSASSDNGTAISTTIRFKKEYSGIRDVFRLLRVNIDASGTYSIDVSGNSVIGLSGESRTSATDIGLNYTKEIQLTIADITAFESAEIEYHKAGRR